MLEKNIILGALQTGVSDNGQWFRVHYLDLDFGVACIDYVSKDTFDNLKSANLPIGARVVAFFTMNERRKIVICGLKQK